MKLYRPSNGDEGDWFMSQFCYQCIKWPVNPDAKKQCLIALKTMAMDCSDKGYPKQWCYVDDKPTCTSFKDRKEYNRNRLKRCNDKHTGRLF